MVESDKYLQLLEKTHSDPQIKQTIREVESFHSFAKSMGVSIEKKAILSSKEEMKFECVNSNWH